MKRILFFLLMVSFCMISKAADWIPVYEDENVTVLFYDSIKLSNDGCKVWIEWEYKKPKTVGTVKYNSFKDYIEYNVEFDKSRTYTTVFYDNGGQVVDSYESRYPNWEYIVPGSIGEVVAESIYEWIR